MKQLARGVEGQDAWRQGVPAPIPLVLRPKTANGAVGTVGLIGIFALLLFLFAGVIDAPIYRKHPALAIAIEGFLVALCALYRANSGPSTRGRHPCW